MKTKMVVFFLMLLFAGTNYASVIISTPNFWEFMDLTYFDEAFVVDTILMPDNPPLTEDPLVAEAFAQIGNPLTLENEYPGIPDTFPTPPDDWAGDNYLISNTVVDENGTLLYDRIWYYERLGDGTIICTFVENSTNMGTYEYDPTANGGGDGGGGGPVEPEPATVLMLSLGGLILRKYKMRG